jgi:hypothetical protein
MGLAIPAALADLSAVLRKYRGLGDARGLWAGVRFLTGTIDAPALSRVYQIPRRGAPTARPFVLAPFDWDRSQALRRSLGELRREETTRLLARVPASTLRNWENDRGFPERPAFRRLAVAPGVLVERLAEGGEGPAEEEPETARPRRARRNFGSRRCRWYLSATQASGFCIPLHSAAGVQKTLIFSHVLASDRTRPARAGRGSHLR